MLSTKEQNLEQINEWVNDSFLCIPTSPSFPKQDWLGSDFTNMNAWMTEPTNDSTSEQKLEHTKEWRNASLLCIPILSSPPHHLFQLIITTLNYSCINYGNQNRFSNLKSSCISWLGLSDSFGYLCHGSTAVRNILFISVWGPSWCVRIWRLSCAEKVNLPSQEETIQRTSERVNKRVAWHSDYLLSLISSPPNDD